MVETRQSRARLRDSETHDLIGRARERVRERLEGVPQDDLGWSIKRRCIKRSDAIPVRQAHQKERKNIRYDLICTTRPRTSARALSS